MILPVYKYPCLTSPNDTTLVIVLLSQTPVPIPSQTDRPHDEASQKVHA